MRKILRYCLLFYATGPIHWCLAVDDGTAQPVVGITERVAWKNNRLVGSPDPPLPYTTETVFDNLNWDRPLYAKAEPGTTNLIVVLQGGETDKPTRILRVDESRPVEAADFLRIDGRLVYGLEFDPNYESNGFVYIFTNGPTSEPERKDRVSRFHVGDAPERQCDPTSEFVIIEWRSMGHDGGELGFGADGMLYISSGDGTTDSDRWLSAQDISNLLGAVLRIDVRQANASTPYSVPTDNPFVDVDGARGELWAFGLRNPWRLWCDRQTGQVWVGNNGQDLWESVHLIRRGENYGWSVYEGSHPFYPQRQCGPAKIVPPTVEHHHTEARSLTGGVVYRGSELPELDGAYIYGDYSTGRIWGVRHDGVKVTWHQELADTIHQIAGFAIAPSGALLVVDHGGGISRLRRSPPAVSAPDFPTRLSETELFESVPNHIVKAGIIPYSVNAPGWNDHAKAERYLTIPADEKIKVDSNRGWHLPDGSVVIQTLSLPQGTSSQRVETRLLLKQQNEWTGYSYLWNEEQTDAELVPKEGADIELQTLTGETLSRHIPSRSECLSCHSRAVNFVLGLSNPQMNRQHDYGAVTAHQFSTFDHIDLFEKTPKADGKALADPYDITQSLETRARSYLHVNCSSCHVEAGGGNARMELEFSRKLDDMQLVSARPQHANFQIADAMLIAPGEPDRSVLLARISRRGAGQMPPLYSRAVDRAGVDLIRNWISSMPRSERKFVRAWTNDELVARIGDLRDRASVDAGKRVYTELGCIQCHRIADEGGGAGPDLTTIATRSTPAQIIQAIVEPSANIAPEYALTTLTTVDGRMLSGRIEFADDETIRLRSPESFDTPITLSTSDIEHQAPSKVSMMPAGILNSCSEEEIRNLLAYLLDPMQERSGNSP